MNLKDQILDILKKEYKAGKTQNMIAKKYNLTQTDVQRLLSGKRSVDKLSLKVFMRMFPNASINLTGDVVSVSADNNSSAFGQVNGNINISDSSPEIKAITRGIMDTKDMSAGEKGRALAEFIKEIKK